MGKASREKGKRGERLWVEKLREHGLDARRSAQSCGMFGQADVACKDLDQFHFEVKNVETFRLRDSLEQAVSDSKDGTIPVVAHKSNRQEWVVVMRADDFIKLAKSYEQVSNSES